MEQSSSVGRALVWFRHTAISEIRFHALCHMGDIIIDSKIDENRCKQTLASLF